MKRKTTSSGAGFRRIIDDDIRKLIGVNIYLLIMLALLKLTGCTDLGTQVDAIAAPTPGWIRVDAFHSARSGVFDFISVEALVGNFPDSLRARVPDSIKVVNHTDRDTAYIGSGITGGWEPGTQLYANYYKKFQFPDGYVDRLPFVLDLSVFVKYNHQIVNH